MTTDLSNLPIRGLDRYVENTAVVCTPDWHADNWPASVYAVSKQTGKEVLAADEITVEIAREIQRRINTLR